MKRLSVMFGVLFTSLVLCVSSARAQFETASVVGSLRDSTGGAIEGATVTLTNTGTAVSAVQKSDRAGNFEFINVKPGTYLVTSEKQGCVMALVDGVVV